MQTQKQQITWKEIAALAGYSVSMCYAVFIGERRNAEIKQVLDEIAAVKPMPKIYTKRNLHA